MNVSTAIKRGLLIAGILILGTFLFTVDWRSAWESLQQLTPLAGLILVGISVLTVVLKAYRWKILVQRLCGQHLSTGFAFNSIIAGVAAGSFLPGRIELAKPLQLKAHYDIPLTKSFSCLVIERVLDLCIFILFLLLSLILIPSQDFIPPSAIYLFTALVILLIILLVAFPSLFLLIITKVSRYFPLPQRYREKVVQLLQEIVQSFTILKSSQAAALGPLSLGTNLLEVVRFYYLLHFFQVDASWAIAGFVFSASLLMGILSSIPGGVGVTEVSASAILSSLLPIGVDLAKLVILLDRIISYYLFILWGSLLMMVQQRREKKTAVQSSASELDVGQ